MANPYQQQIFQRKLVYLGLIVALLGVSWGFRTYGIEPRAKELGLVEESRGDVELLGAAARTGLSGMRGFATCALWMDVMDQQKKNQLTTLERTVNQLTRLQPHLVTPWLFLSWNLSYNVSRDCDRVADKYFYISRGIQLLARGEKQNAYQPVLRRDVGYYHQHKICQSDEANTHRSLFQLSCIPPHKRDPEQFRDNGEINLEKLKQFCKDHPQLARRLHSPPLPYDMRKEFPKFRCASAVELLQFIEDNQDVPSLYVERTQSEEDWKQGRRKEDPLDRFPLLPPDRSGKHNSDDFTEEQFTSDEPPDEFDAFHVAKAWYGYAQECLPPPGKYSGTSAPITDRLRQRVPKTMATVLFRSTPAMAQRFIAERLQDEGWFDADPFLITGWFRGGPSGDTSVEIGIRRPWTVEAWRKSFEAWRRYGLENKLYFEQEFQRKNMEELAKRFQEEFKVQPGQQAPEFHPDLINPEIEAMRDAHEILRNQRADLRITNFDHFIMRSKVEAEPRTVTARKHFYQAEHLRLVAQALNKALEMYEHPDAFLAWRAVLEEHKEFRADDLIQEQSFETELKYLRLYRRLNEDKLTPDLALLAALGQSSAAAPLSADWTLLGLFSRPQLQPEFGIVGPLDKDSKGNPFIPAHVKEGVLTRRGLKKSPKPDPKTNQSGATR